MKYLSKIYMIRLFLIGGLLLCQMLSIRAQEDVVLEKIVGKIGTELLLKTEIDQNLAYLQSRKRLPLSVEERCDIIQDILNTKLLISQADLDSVVVTPLEIEDILQNKVDYILGLMNNDVELFRSTYGKSVQEVKESFRDDLVKQETAKKMQQQIISTIRITPSEVLNYFESIPEDSLPFFNSEVEVGEIVYYPVANEGEKNRAKQYLVEIKELIEEGEATFEEMAKKYSDDRGSATLGGNLGWQKRGTFVPEFEAAAYNLDENELSEIVESPFGYHLIRLEKRRGNSILTKHILITPDITEKDIAIGKLKMDSIVNLLRTDSITFEYAVSKFSDENIQSYNNGGRMINPSTGKTFFETQELEPDVFFAIDTIEVEDITEPVLFSDPRNGYFYRIMKLFSRTPPHRADISLDYSRVKEAALSQRREKYISQWVTKTLQHSYIELDKSYFQEYMGCEALSKWFSKAGMMN